MTARGTARQRLLDAAARLFYSDGVVATGIDAITAEAGVAKMSLYNNFSSKEALILAYLDARHEEWLSLYQLRLRSAMSPADRILAVFDAYVDHAAMAYEHGFRGCGLLNAAAELPAGSDGRDRVRRHKEEVESILAGQLALVAPPKAATLAEQLSFLLEGAMSRAGLEGKPDRLLRARELATTLLDAL